MTRSSWAASVDSTSRILKTSERLAEQRDDDSTIDAVTLLDLLERCANAEAQLDMLYALGERELRVLAWRLIALLAGERANQVAIQELMHDDRWWESYRTVSRDARLIGATPGDVFQWALIHFRGGPHRYEQAVVKRSS